MKINLPNKLTLIRIAMIPVFVVLMYFENLWCQLAAAVVFIAASITDYLDGNIARKNNLVTNFGKFADPIADKMLVMSAFVMLVAQGRMPAWVCASSSLPASSPCPASGWWPPAEARSLPQACWARSRP